MSEKLVGFDTQRYVESQVQYIRTRILEHQDCQTFIEFGGKPFGDHHAERVLPGYDPNCKAEILAQLMPLAKIVMVVNAKDILLPENGRTLQGRIRGDSGLRYAEETIRLVKQARELGLNIDAVVLSVTPLYQTQIDKHIIAKFEEDLGKIGLNLYKQYEAPDYPDPQVLISPDQSFGLNETVSDNRHLVVFSPGGGSGKFGVILYEMYRALVQGKRPNFIKFETFPVFALEAHHPLNLAFEAATADLKNTIVSVGSGNALIATTYDKDVENFVLLKELFYRYSGDQTHPILSMQNPTDMGVNRLHDGITNMEVITTACEVEIVRRIERYNAEQTKGIEKIETVERALGVLDRFRRLYS